MRTTRRWWTALEEKMPSKLHQSFRKAYPAGAEKSKPTNEKKSFPINLRKTIVSTVFYTSQYSFSKADPAGAEKSEPPQKNNSKSSSANKNFTRFENGSK
jgi:hypothetical protein